MACTLPHRSTWLTIGLLATVFVLMGVDVADGDGARTRAAQVEVPSEHEDELNPPDDVSDWRYVALESPTDLTISLNVESSDKSARLTIRRSAGDTLTETETTDGSVSVQKSLEPGIVYVSVTSKQALTYTIEFSK